MHISTANDQNPLPSSLLKCLIYQPPGSSLLHKRKLLSVNQEKEIRSGTLLAVQFTRVCVYICTIDDIRKISVDCKSALKVCAWDLFVFKVYAFILYYVVKDEVRREIGCPSIPQSSTLLSE